MKISGRELQKFLDEGWPDDNWYLEDGPDEIHDENIYETLEFDAVRWQGLGEDPSPDSDGLSLTTLIKKWRKTRTSTIFVVVVPTDRVDDFKTYCKSIKAEITK